MRKILIILLVLTCMLGFAACLKLPQHLPSAEDAFYELYPKDTVINIDENNVEIALVSVVVDKYGVEYDVAWQSSNTELAEIVNREDGVFVALTPTQEPKEFTLTATISDSDGETTACTVTYCLYECVHVAGPAATCIAAQVCTACDKVLAEAKGHNAGAAPTCTEPQRCTVCHVVLKGASGHSYSDDDDCTTAVRCTRVGCGEIIVEAKDAHLDADLDGKCDNDNCTVVVGIDIDNRTSEYRIAHNTIYNFSGVERIFGSDIKVYNSDKTEEKTLPYDVTEGEVLYIEALSADAALFVGDRHTIPVSEFEIDKTRTATVNSDGYITYFTGYEGKFAFYFGENDNAVVQMYIDGEFKDIPNRYAFDLEDGKVASFKLSAKNGEAEIEFTIHPVPVEDTEYRLGITDSGEELYFTGKNAYGVSSWLGTSSDAEKAVAVKLELVIAADADLNDDVNKDMYRLYFMKGEEKVYIRMYSTSAGKPAGLELTTDVPTELYTYDDEYRTLVFTDESGNRHFLGSAHGDNVITPYQWGKITENSVVRFYLY